MSFFCGRVQVTLLLAKRQTLTNSVIYVFLVLQVVCVGGRGEVLLLEGDVFQLHTHRVTQRSLRGRVRAVAGWSGAKLTLEPGLVQLAVEGFTRTLKGLHNS